MFVKLLTSWLGWFGRLTIFVAGLWCGQAVVDGRKVLPRDTEANLGGVDDMTKLVYLHEPGVLCNLALRYTLNEIYVSVSIFSLSL